MIINRKVKCYALMFVCTFLMSCSQDSVVSGVDENLISECEGTQYAGVGSELGGGVFSMGDEHFYREESPVKEQRVAAFSIDRTEVTNAQFEKFVAATGYVSRAEKGFDKQTFPNIDPMFRIPGSMVFVPLDLKLGATGTWWKFVAGANWRHPYGPESTIKDKENYPVVQITYDDALAYAHWLGRRLPTEVEWEYAALGGANVAQDKPSIKEANYWQGVFPLVNTEEDGFGGAAPVGCFESNGYDIYDMVGNVWELTSSAYYPSHNAQDRRQQYPQGFDANQPGIPVHVIKGGSYLCAQNYCQRYRPASRQAQDAYLASSHVGFRTAK